jgi:hypothetical protein
MSTTSGWQLAQVNIGRIRAPMTDPVMAEFAAALEEINALAEATPGFVWRLKDDSGNATSIHVFPDPRLLVNMSVWSDFTVLQGYVYRSAHGKFFARRQAWFETYDGVYLALWWIPAGHLPTVDEAKERLALLGANGPTAQAFTFRMSFSPPDAARAAP